MHEFWIWFAGVGFGVSVTLALCSWLHHKDHVEWCKLVDRQQAILDKVLPKEPAQ